MSEPKYPHIKVTLVGTDGNAFAILGKVKQALQKHHVSKEEITAFTECAMSGDYDHLLQECFKTVTVN